MAFAGHPADGEFTYNFCRFTNAIKLNASSEPIYDDAGRTIVCIKHSISVIATVVSANGVDSDLDALRCRLQHPGAPLTLTGKGFGNLIVNVGFNRDVRHGPKPQLLRWQPVGNKLAADVEWSVETHVQPCCTAGRSTGVMAFNYEVGYSQDAAGFVTRTITGYYEIALSQAGVDNAEQYWNQFFPAFIPGYERTPQRTESKDRRRMDFTIVDTPKRSPNALPPHITAASGTHDVGWSRRGEKAFPNSLRVELVREPFKDGSWLWQKFLGIFNQITKGQKAAGCHPFLMDLRISTDLFGYGSAFAAAWRMMSDFSTAFVGKAGLWKPLGTNWNDWAVSLQNSAFHPLGAQKLTHAPNSDAIVNLCGSSLGVNITPPLQEIVPPVPSAVPEFKNEKPPPERSWVAYDAAIASYETHSPIRQRILQDGPPDTPRGNTIQPNMGREEPDVDTTGAIFIPTFEREKKPVIQKRGPPTKRVKFKGEAIRAGYPIPRPTVNYIGGVRAEPFGEHFFVCQPMADKFGVPLFYAVWEMDYYADGATGVIHPADNLAMKIRGDVA